jgi:small-conductance mechanosensitive channel
MDWLPKFDLVTLYRLLATGGLVVLTIALNMAVSRLLTRVGSQTMTGRRRRMVAARNIIVLLMFGAMFALWYDQLVTLATALLVVAFALVVATKELLMNVTGFLFRSGSRSFGVGDRIEVGAFHGDVIDQGFMGVTMLEIDPRTRSNQFTGRSIFVPNATFLTQAVINESYLKDYMFHIITVPLKAGGDWQRAEEQLLAAANEICAPYLDEVRRYIKGIEAKQAVDTPTVEPRVNVTLPDAEKINLILRVPVPSRRRGRTEQAIVRRYLELMERGDSGVAQ